MYIIIIYIRIFSKLLILIIKKIKVIIIVIKMNDIVQIKMVIIMIYFMEIIFLGLNPDNENYVGRNKLKLSKEEMINIIKIDIKKKG